MRLPSIFRLRLRSLFARKKVERELDEELLYHLERQIEEYVAAGMSVEDARHAALRAIGGVEQRKAGKGRVLPRSRRRSCARPRFSPGRGFFSRNPHGHHQLRRVAKAIRRKVRGSGSGSYAERHSANDYRSASARVSFRPLRRGRVLGNSSKH